MSGTMRKMGVYLGLLEDVDGEYLEEETPEHSREASRAQAPRTPARDAGAPQVSSLDERRRTAPVTPTSVVTPLSRITTLHPRTYNDARVIGENFRDGVPVIMNLSEMSDSDAKRLVDFAAGLVFSVHGSIEKVTNKVFLLSPPDVSVAAEDKQRIAEGGFFNQS